MIPKRKTEIATNIAKVVEEQFISVDEITDNIITEQDKQHIIDYIKVRVKLILSEKMTLIPSTIRNLVQKLCFWNNRRWNKRRNRWIIWRNDN